MLITPFCWKESISVTLVRVSGSMSAQAGTSWAKVRPWGITKERSMSMPGKREGSR